jgi:hypothetical protein
MDSPGAVRHYFMGRNGSATKNSWSTINSGLEDRRLIGQDAAAQLRIV